MHYLEENGLIDISGVQEAITDMHIEKRVREVHSHKIWQNQSDKRWYTYVSDPETGKRKLISRKTKRKLLQFICDSNEELSDVVIEDIPTIRQLYPKWLEHKKLMSQDTYIPRIQTDWNRYYENDPIVDRPINTQNKIQLEDWIMHLIRDNEMTKKNFYNVSMIIRQIFQYAYDSEILRENTFARVRKNLGKFFRKVRKPMDETQVYTDEEIAALEQLVWDDFAVKGKKKFRLAPLAVLFQLYTGLRVSEVGALKYSDIQQNGKLHVQRMLVKSTGEVRERTKGFDGEREVYIPAKARNIIAATLSYRKEHGISCEEYIFSETDTPFPERTINDYLERYCNRLGILYRSSHKLRKTAVSSLVNSGISLNAVRAFAGHVDEKTTLAYYTFDRENEATRNEQFEKALSFSRAN